MVDLAPGHPGSDVRGINSKGEIAGLVYLPGFVGSLAVVWKPQ